MRELLEDARSATALPAPGVAHAIREAAGVHLTELADTLDVHRTTLYRWEAGESRPKNNKRRAAYAQALNELRRVL